MLLPMLALEPDPVTTFAPLGVYAVTLVVMTWWLYSERTGRKEAERQRDEALARERSVLEQAKSNAERQAERMEQFVPLAGQAVSTARDVQRGLSQTLERSSPERVEGALKEVLRLLAEQRQEQRQERSR